eukprot:4711298-Pleurochrysis_carterae.AAC.5
MVAATSWDDCEALSSSDEDSVGGECSVPSALKQRLANAEAICGQQTLVAISKVLEQRRQSGRIGAAMQFKKPTMKSPVSAADPQLWQSISPRRATPCPMGTSDVGARVKLPTTAASTANVTARVEGRARCTAETVHGGDRSSWRINASASGGDEAADARRMRADRTERSRPPPRLLRQSAPHGNGGTHGVGDASSNGVEGREAARRSSGAAGRGEQREEGGSESRDCAEQLETTREDQDRSLCASVRSASPCCACGSPLTSALTALR